MVNADVEKLYENITQYIHLYNRDLMRSRQWLANSLDKLNRLLLDADNLFSQDLDNSRIFTSMDTYNETMDVAKAISVFLENYGSLAYFKNPTKSEEFFFPTYATLGKKNDVRCDSTLMKPVLDFQLENIYDYNSFLATYEWFDSVKGNISLCLHEYRDYLQSTLEWLSESRLTYITR
jgi:hypothetical protein